ncbi:class I SAM-dependent methyltransferase [Modestobacter sp. SYSU DS0290]
MSDPVAANRANWDERVPAHLVAYGVEQFIASPHQLSDVVREDLRLLGPHLPGGTPDGLTLAHLQCHIGTDTLSWARLGARVTGIDFSPAATAAARQIAARAGLAATFVDSDVAGAADAVGGAQFDVVYTGIGALTWLPDLRSWAATVAHLLRPGGVFFVRDGHPLLTAVRSDATGGSLALEGPYFGTGAPLRDDGGATYADDEVRLANAVTYQWPYSIADVLQSLLGAGLRLTSFAEHRSVPWRALPSLVPGAGGWVLPDRPERLPLTFSLTATAP